MNPESIEVCGQLFPKDLAHFSFNHPFQEISDMAELLKLGEFPNLISASFDSTNLNDEGLKHLVLTAQSLENLSLQDTHITDVGIHFLPQLPKLVYLRLKENDQLTNACIPGINLLHALEDLQIHETSIGQDGLKKLFLPNLKNLLVNSENSPSFIETLLELSNRIPECTILIKGRAAFKAGEMLWSNP